MSDDLSERFDSRIHPAFTRFMEGKDDYGKPYTTHERAALMRAFEAGWTGRFRAAATPDTTTLQVGELAILREHFDALKAVLDNHLDHFVYQHNQREALARQVKSLRAQVEISGKDPDEAPLWRRIAEQRKQLRALDEALVEAKARAWDEGVATALNHAILNPDKITLRLEHLDGRPWQNPHRKVPCV